MGKRIYGCTKAELIITNVHKRKGIPSKILLLFGIYLLDNLQNRIQLLANGTISSLTMIVGFKKQGFPGRAAECGGRQGRTPPTLRLPRPRKAAGERRTQSNITRFQEQKHGTGKWKSCRFSSAFKKRPNKAA